MASSSCFDWDEDEILDDRGAAPPAQDSAAASNSVAIAPAVAPPSKPAPRTRGGHALRRLLRETDLPAARRVPRGPGTVEYARACYQAARAPATDDLDLRDTPARVSRFRLASAVGSGALQTVCLALDKWAEDQQHKKDRVVQQLLRTPQLPLMSFSALAHATQHSQAHVSRSVQRTAAAMQLCAEASWSTLFADVCEMLAVTDSVKGVLLLTHARYDETPSRMLVRPNGEVVQAETEPTSAVQEACVAKVLQIEYGVTMVFQREDGATHALTGMAPRMLAVLDRTSAENMRQVLEQRCKIPQFNRLARLFDWHVRCVCTDRFAGNFAAEASMQAAAEEQELPYTRDHTACEMHMVATAQSKASELPGLKLVVEGILACGLTMTAAQATKRFRQSLRKAFAELLTIVAGSPPRGHVEEFRGALYDHFLPLFPDSNLAETRPVAAHLYMGLACMDQV